MTRYCIALAILSITRPQIFASNCTTIADGPFASTTVWNCACDPISCDTLIVRHVLEFETDLLISNPFLHLTTTGSLAGTGSGQLVITGNIENEGSISGTYIRFFENGVLVNTGMVTGGVVITVKDTTRNYGTIAGTDSLVVGVYRNMLNYGSVSAGKFYSIGNYTNLGQTTALSMVNRFVFSNAQDGMVHVEGKMISGLIFDNIGSIEADSLIIQSGYVLMYGSINCSSALIIGDPPNDCDLYLQSTGSITTQDLLVNEGTIIYGPGTVCITGYSENHGRFGNLLDVCDLSRTTAAPPFLDVNTGTWHPSVTFCTNTTCDGVGISEAVDLGALRVYPQPITGPFSVGCPSAFNGSLTVEILDMMGRTTRIGTFPNTPLLQLDRGYENAGMHVMILRDSHGKILQQPIMFGQ